MKRIKLKVLPYIGEPFECVVKRCKVMLNARVVVVTIGKFRFETFLCEDHYNQLKKECEQQNSAKN